MKNWINKIKEKFKSGQINLRTVTIAIVIVACVVGTVAATQITSTREGTKIASETSLDKDSKKVQNDSTETDDESQDEVTDTSADENTTKDKSSTDKETAKSNKSNATNSGSTEKNTASNSSNGTSSGSSETSKTNTGTSSSVSNKTNSSTANSDSATSVKNISCTIEIRCDSVSGNQKLTNNGHPELETYAANPQILYSTISIAEGSSAYDVLMKACKAKGIQTDSTYTAAYKSYYIKGINYLYEFSAGPNSGWTYQVNGESPNYGCSSYKVSEGDSIVFNYVTSY